ncbi:MAG: Rrf2 family transcriptional regulator [Planctomycetes bacterium]|nr:Rrf2 family transcriptional regulator [Planctomycetota bacterium]
MISQTAEYALRALVWLSEHQDLPQTTEQIATAMNIPTGYLSKVLQTLGRANLVQSQRGLGGGFVLAKPPDRISILKIINAVDPIQRIRECPLGRKHVGEKLCPLHDRLDAALALIEDTFRACTLADLCPSEGERPAVCPDNSLKEKPDPQSG